MSDTNAQLLLNSGQKPFPQTGSWNMLDLAKLPVQATLGILSRYSAARVNPYTALVGEVLCQNFQLTTTGRKNLEKAVGSLKVVGSLDDTLEFGFGMEDVVRTMVKTERGCICLALCAALDECYSDNIAVEVLLEMARLFNVDGQYMPSSQSWKDLLSACAGTLSSSGFPILAEHLMQLLKDEYRLGAFQRLAAPLTSVRSCSRTGSIAEALSGLARISRGEMQAMTLYGGSDAGWLAAFAEWLLDLKVMISNFDGTLYYINGDVESIQVHVVRRQKNDEIAPDILAAETTFVLNDVSQIFEKEARSPDAAVVSGRLEWKHALSSAFLSDFNRLMEISHTLGDCIGSAARLFKGLAQADEAFPFKYRLACTSYSDAAHGAGFVLNTIQWFPELKRLKDIMLKSVSQDFASAHRRYEACISVIRAHCNCITCQSKTTGHDAFDDEDEVPMTPAPEDDETPGSQRGNESDEDNESTEDWDPDKFCEVVITETVIFLSRALSNVLLEDKNLLPTRSGLELAYGRQMNHRLSSHLGRSALRKVGPIAFCLDFDNNFLFGMQENNEEGIEIRLHTALEIFAGRRPSSTSSNYSALCANGICAFLGIISEASSGGADIESASKIHILPGRISHEKKSYSMLIDRVQPVDLPDTGFMNAIELTHIERPQLNNHLSVRETYTGLEVWIEIETRPGRDGRKLRKFCVGPLKLAVWLTSRRGLVSCKRLRYVSPRMAESSLKKDCRWSGPISLREVREAAAEQRSIRFNDKAIDVLNYKDMSLAIAAVASTADLDPKYSIFIVDRECLSCCMKAVLAVDRPERPNFCILQLPL
jgi:hypothetical protein